MPFELPIRVYYEDTDAGGIVYHANYLSYFERARTELLRELGFEQDELMAQGIAFVVKQLTVDYHHPAKFNDSLKVQTQISQLRRASLGFAQEIFCSQGNLICSGNVQVVCIAHESKRAVVMPDHLLKELKGAR